MSCPSRTEQPADRSEWNQSPPLLSADLTTRQDFGGTVNAPARRRTLSHLYESRSELSPLLSDYLEHSDSWGHVREDGFAPWRRTSFSAGQRRDGIPHLEEPRSKISRIVHTMWKFARFVGPGFLIAVSYIDPGNYATDVAAGAETKYALLFIIMLSNIFAIFIQSLSIKLGSVTGLNLAENCKAHLPHWLTILLYGFAESAIIATDIAEVSAQASLRDPYLKGDTDKHQGRGVSRIS